MSSPDADTGQCSADCSQASGMLFWVKSLYALFTQVGAVILSEISALKVLYCPMSSEVRCSMCDQRKGKLWVSVSQHSAKSHQLMTVLFVEILPEKECSYDGMRLSYLHITPFFR